MRPLPRNDEASIGDTIKRKANESVRVELDNRANQRVKKPRKEQTLHSEEYRADIGKFAAEKGNACAQKHLKIKFPEFGESTVYWFKQKYLSY